MWEGGGFGVAVTITAARPRPEGEPGSPAGVARRRVRLCEVLDPAGFDAAELAGELRAVADLRAQLAAYEAGLVAAFAAGRPAQFDVPDDQPGHGVEGWTPSRVPAAGVSEFFADELAVVIRSSRAAATSLTERALVLTGQLQATWHALADGLIDEPRAKAICAALGGQSVDAGGVVDAAVVAEVEAQALTWAVAGETPQRLQERTAAAVIAVDEAAADRRRRRAERAADVRARAVRDGMAQLVADLPAPVAAACRDAVDEYARLLKADGDPRPIGQLRALVLTDLVLRPWDTSRPPVTAHLQVLAPLPTLGQPGLGSPGHPVAPGPAQESGNGWARMPGAEDAASVSGMPITAGLLRELLAQLGAVCPGGLAAPVGGSLSISLTDPQTGALRATVTASELERLARRGCPHHPPATGDRSPAARRPSTPRAPATDAGRADGSGDEDCGCGVLDRPPAVSRYTPSPAQYRLVRARDRTCRFPGCRCPAARTDVDHVVPRSAGGITDCANLCCLCRRHHRLKTHTRDWRFQLTPDGVLTVTTPSGVARTTRPPGLHLPTDQLLVPIGGPPPDPADDPPPF